MKVLNAGKVYNAQGHLRFTTHYSRSKSDIRNKNNGYQENYNIRSIEEKWLPA